MTQSYKGYEILLISYKLKSRSWAPWARVDHDQGGRYTFSNIQSRGPMGFKTQQKANACALELAKTWIKHRLQ